MKFGVIADIHFQLQSSLSAGVATSGVVTSRLKDRVDAVKWAGSVLAKRDIDTLFVAGDVFNCRYGEPFIVLDAAYRAFRHIREKHGIEVVVIPGNHDCPTQSPTVHALRSLADNADGVTSLFVVDKPDVVYANRQGGVALLPWNGAGADYYAKQVEAWLSQVNPPSVLIGHDLIRGVIVGGDDAIPPQTFQFGKWKAALFGDVHDRSVISTKNPNAQYVGTLLPQDWDDADKVRGMVVVDTAADQPIEFVENKVSPRFVTVADTADAARHAEKRGQDYIRVMQHADESVLDKLRHHGIRVELDPAAEIGVVESSGIEAMANRSVGNTTDSAKSIIARFVESTVPARQPKRRKRLRKLLTGLAQDGVS